MNDRQKAVPLAWRRRDVASESRTTDEGGAS